jgi:hypothetical protein
MTRSLLVVILAFVAFSFVACEKITCCCESPDSLPVKYASTTFKMAMKGWELYSWPANGENCTWKYTLAQGSNRLKSYSEVTSDTAFNIIGEQQLKLLLNKLPVSENILWVGKSWLGNVWGRR